jgi:hypothetical protein
VKEHDPGLYPNLAKLEQACAKWLISSEAKQFSPAEVEQKLCSMNPFYWMETYGFIESASAEGQEVDIIPFALNVPQLKLANQVSPYLMPGDWKRTKLIVLKSRKMGISTFFAAMDYWFMRHMPGCDVFVVADKNAHTLNIYKMIRLFWEKDKLAGKPTGRTMSRNKQGLFLSNRSTLEMDSGETRNPATSQDVHILHCCVDEDTPVVCRDGFLVPAKKTLNKKALAHNLRPCRIVAHHRAEPQDGYAIQVFGNPFPLRVTKDHRLLARVGPSGSWIKAESIATTRPAKYKKWYVGYPIRPFWRQNETFRHLHWKLKTRERPQGGGRTHANYPNKFPLTFEMGRIAGWYLAEGSIGRAMKKYPSVISLGLHKDEVKTVLGYIEAVGEPTFRGKGYAVGNRGIVDIRSSYWAKVFQRFFGKCDKKRIPDWTWSTNEEYAKGIIQGYIEGDGHFRDDGTSISISSIRPQLLVQLRELLLTLGFGYSCLYYRDGGQWYGRNCKPIWTLGIFGATGYAVRKMMGKAARMPVSRHKWVISSFRVKGCAPRIWLPVESIEPCSLERPLDLEVDHHTHSYMLLGCASHNSESAKWPQIVDAETSLLNSVSRSGFAWQVKESTAFGINKWKTDCMAALEKRSSWDFLFLEWPDMPDCSVELNDEERKDFKLTTEEMELISTFSLSMENIKFRREKVGEIGISKFKQDFPLHPREPFEATTNSYFDPLKVEDRKDDISFYRVWKQFGYDDAIEQFPRIANEIRYTKPGAKEYLKVLSTRCKLPKQVNVSVVKGKVTYAPSDSTVPDSGQATMWLDPDPHRQYVVIVDPAEGISSDGYTSDNSVIQVIDTFAREQACEMAGTYDEEVTARYAVLLAKLYGDAMLVIEMNCKCGGAVLTYVKERYKYFNLYRRQILTRSQTVQNDEGWRTNMANKQSICYALKIHFKEDDCTIHGTELLDEMANFVEEKGKLHAAVGYRDDRIMTFAIGLYVIDSTPGLRSMKASEAGFRIAAALPRRISTSQFGVRRLSELSEPYPAQAENPSHRFKTVSRY